VADIIVIGSGATGAHFALSALRRGHRVTMVDVGYARPEPVQPELSFRRLKDALDDPVEYFLGRRLERVVYPAAIAKHYGFPPSKAYVFDRPSSFNVVSRGFEPMLSFARGGLAEAWTGGCYEFSAEDLREFPIAPADLESGYAEVARRIGVSAERDDIARFSPFTAPYLPPLPLDDHSARILERYGNRRERLNRELRFFLGRSRVATLSRDHGQRGACTSLGRCLWGCPRHSLWSPSLTVAECQAFDGFAYLPDHFVSHFYYDARGRVQEISAVSAGGVTRRLRGDVVVLAAGALGTSAIYLMSVLRREGRRVTLGGLMDNQHAVIPFVNTRRLGSPVNTETYQFHLLALAVAGEGGTHEAHGQITTLRSAAVHPIVQSLPFDLATGMTVFRRIRSALGVANVWHAARRDPANAVSLRSDTDGHEALAIECDVAPADRVRLARTIDVVRGALGELDCVAPRRQVQVLPLGSSVHYAGTLPMTTIEDEHTCAPDGRVRGFENLIVADGAAFPALPAKNLTFTLMANAVRLAELLPRD
jgi:choline dehydrogenase-like flavoprotein